MTNKCARASRAWKPRSFPPDDPPEATTVSSRRQLVQFVSRVLGGPLLLFGLLGLVTTSLGKAWSSSTPALDGLAWTAPLRSASEWLVPVGIAAAGLALLVRRHAVPVAAIAALLAVARFVFDVVTIPLGDELTAREETILTGDSVALFAALLGLAFALAAGRVGGRTAVGR